MTSYMMEARENYDPTRAAQADSGTFTNGTALDAHYLGLSFDAINREFVYTAIIMQPISGGLATNTTGHDLWDGLTAITAGATFAAETNFNFYVARKNIDTGVVTFHTAYDPAATVPSGIYGDGTARRYVSDTNTNGQYPMLTDPRTHDTWAHMESCQLYVFRAADSYTLHISPLRPVGGINNPILPIGMETEWVYATEYTTASGGGMTSEANLYLVPRLTTAAETTADKLLAYATYTLPYTATGSGAPQQYFRTAIDGSGNFWSLSINSTGSVSGVKLNKFTKPSAFVYPTPPSDGGFTDVTPWTSSTGPNALFAGLTSLVNNTSRLAAMFSPDRVQLNLLYCVLNNDVGTADNYIGHTWYNTSDGTWGSSIVAQGYMTADWVHTDNASEAAFDLTGKYIQTNTYLDADNFYDSGAYAFRWIFVEVNPVSGGVEDFSTPLFVLVKLTWNTGAAPTTTVFIPENGWDAAYTAYATAISYPYVVRGSIQSTELDYYLGYDTGVFDPTTGAFWFSGMTNADGTGDPPMFQLDPAFTAREHTTGPATTNAQPPLLRLTTSLIPPSPPPPVGNGRGFLYLRQFFKSDEPTPTPPVQTPPVNTVAPSVNQAEVGLVSTVTNGTWTGADSFDYQWKVAGSNVGTDATTYTPASGDVGKALECIVTAHNAAGSTSATSNVLTVSGGSLIDLPNTAAYMAMISAGVEASGGKAYLMGATDFGDIVLSGVDFSSNPVVIRGQTGTVVSSMDFRNVSGFTHEDFNVYGVDGVYIHDSTGSILTFTNVSSVTSQSMGSQSGNAWGMRNLTSCVITINGQNNSDVNDVWGRNTVVAMIDCDTTNTFKFFGITSQNIGQDGYLMNGASSMTFDSCLMLDQFWSAGAHPNAWHWFPSFDTGAPCENIVVKNCGVLQGSSGMGVQGYVQEQVVNISFSNCWHYAGTFFIAYSNAAGSAATYDNCFCQGFGVSPTPYLITRGGAVNTSVTNCTLTSLDNYTADGANPGYVPAIYPGSNTIIANASAYGDFATFDAWKALHPTARNRP